MSRFDEFKKELKNLDEKTMVRKERYWNENYSDEYNSVMYDILHHTVPLCNFDEDIKNIIKKYGYETYSSRIITRAYKSDKELNTRTAIIVPKSDL